MLDFVRFVMLEPRCRIERAIAGDVLLCNAVPCPDRIRYDPWTK